MRPGLITTAAWLAGAIAVLASGEPTARAEGMCDGRPLPALQRAVCRDQLEHARSEAAEAEKYYDAELKAPGDASLSADARSKHIADVTAKRDAARQRQLAAAAELVNYALQDAYDENHCERLLTLCLDRDGDVVAATPSEAPPTVVHPGDQLTVIVLARPDDAKGKVSVRFEPRKSLDTQFDVRAPSPKTMALEAEVVANPSQVTFTPLPFPSPPVPDDAEDLTISFQRAAADDERGADKEFVIPNDRGRSYYSVAFLVATTYKGDRRVLRDLGTTSDHAVDPGLALNVFPGGRERGVIGYARRWRGLRRWLANNIGFQLGTDLDLTKPTDKLYAGLVFEPVAGLALVGGVTLRKVNVVPPAGALPALSAMDGSAPTDTRYVTRGYIGITMTLDLIDTISTFGSDLRKIKLQ